jgi:hypothetical protein
MWDVFISHASEDKDAIARPLAAALAERGLSVWLDEHELELGDRLSRKVDEGLAESRYGVVILSEHFFTKEWPRWELDGLAQRENLGRKVVLPVWHGVSRERVAAFSPMLASRLAVTTDHGIEKVVSEVCRVVLPNHTESISIANRIKRIAEYLYLDRGRIQSYHEQCAGSVAATVSEHAKVMRLLSELAPTTRNERHFEFGLATFTARRAFLPSSLSKRSSFPGLALWMCRGPKPGFTYLIEDFPRADGHRHEWSGNTALGMLLRDLSEEMKSTTADLSLPPSQTWDFVVEGDFHSAYQRDALTKIFSEGNVPTQGDVAVLTGGGGIYEAHSGDLRFVVEIEQHRDQPHMSRVRVRRDAFCELCARFAVAPSELLAEWGAEVGPERQIDTLFRIRHTMIEAAAGGHAPATIGYPIAIAASPSPLLDD